MVLRSIRMNGGFEIRLQVYESFFILSPSDSSSEEEEEEEEEDDDNDDDDDEEEMEGYGTAVNERLSPSSLDESGLGLLARFAASAIPSPIIGPSVSIVQLEAKQKAKKKEERQSLMGMLATVPWGLTRLA